MTRGFLILAHGKPEYLKFAANLAMSIREKSQYPVAILGDWGKNAFQADTMLKDFQKVALAWKHDKPFYAKTVLNQYTPFDDTIYLDADSLCINCPDYLFETDYEFHTHLVRRLSIKDEWTKGWAPLKPMFEFYGWNPDAAYLETNSSYIRWKSDSPLAKQIWRLYEYLYSTYPFPDYHKKLFAWYPDELALNAALMFLAHDPGKGSPVYFHYKESGLPDRKMLAEKAFMSLPGVDSTHSHFWRYYNNQVNRMHGFKVSRQFKANYRAKRRIHQPWNEHNIEEFRKLIHG